MSSQNLSRPTINDVARLAGVSISTVSRVINQTAPVADETVETVRRAIEMLGFQPHPGARRLAGGKTQTLGLLLPDLTNPFFSQLLRGIEGSVRESGFDLLVHFLNLRAYPNHQQRPRPLSEHNTDGLIIFTDNMANVEIIRLHRQGFPMVLLFRSAPDGLPIPTVNIDNAKGTQAAIDHLIERCGRRRIAFLQGLPGNEDSHWREMSYRQSLAAHGLIFDPRLVARGDYTEASAMQAVQQWLAADLTFDAVFTGDDFAAIGVISALNKAGIDVPGQVSVVGFDDVDVARHFNPPLTTVRSPIDEAGRWAAELLMQLIRTGAAESIMLPTELVVRKSCGSM